jgi:hypothetical protein
MFVSGAAEKGIGRAAGSPPNEPSAYGQSPSCGVGQTTVFWTGEQAGAMVEAAKPVLMNRDLAWDSYEEIARDVVRAVLGALR